MKSPLKLIALFSCGPSWSSPWGSPSESRWSRGWNSKSFATTWGVHSEPKLKILSKKVMGKILLPSPFSTSSEFLNKIFNFFYQFSRALSVVHPKQIQVSMLKSKTIGYTVYMHWITWILQWMAKKLIRCQVIKKFEEIVLVQTALLVINHQHLANIQHLASQFCVRR